MNPTEPPTRPVLIGVAGGSGSGKTTVVQEIVRALGPDGRSVAVPRGQGIDAKPGAARPSHAVRSVCTVTAGGQKKRTGTPLQPAPGEV